jgi:hypothetical protein
MIKYPIVLQNVVPEDKQEELKMIMFESLFPWFYRSSLSKSCYKIFDKDFSNAPGFAHVFFNDDGMIGDFYNYLEPVVTAACKELDIPYKGLYYGRAFFQHPLTTHSGLTIPHVDNPKEHIVLIYYVMDSDGETVIFDKTTDNPQEQITDISEKNIVQKIMPRQGNVLAFNGNTYHANILPKEHMRCIVNFNLIV